MCLVIYFVRVFDGRCFVRFDSRVSNVFDARMRTTLAQRLVSIVLSVFDQTCFNRLATHFNISMFGHQTMFDGVCSPNIYRLSRPLKCRFQKGSSPMRLLQEQVESKRIGRRQQVT